MYSKLYYFNINCQTMIVFGFLFIFTLTSAARLDRQYLPPPGASSAGGSGNILQSPIGLTSSTSQSSSFPSTSRPFSSSGQFPSPSYQRPDLQNQFQYQQPQRFPQSRPQFRPQIRPQSFGQTGSQEYPQVVPQNIPQSIPQGVPQQYGIGSAFPQSRPQNYPQGDSQDYGSSRPGGFGIPSQEYGPSPQIIPQSRPQGYGQSARPQYQPQDVPQRFPIGVPQVQQQQPFGNGPGLFSSPQRPSQSGLNRGYLPPGK